MISCRRDDNKNKPTSLKSPLQNFLPTRRGKVRQVHVKKDQQRGRGNLKSWWKSAEGILPCYQQSSTDSHCDRGSVEAEVDFRQGFHDRADRDWSNIPPRQTSKCQVPQKGRQISKASGESLQFPRKTERLASSFLSSRCVSGAVYFIF